MKPRKTDALTQDQKALVLESFIPEIKKIWSHIKAFVGLSGGDAWEERAKEAALARFDESREGFKFIKRQYLEKKKLYWISRSNEYRDFQGGLLKMMVMDNFGFHMSVRRINTIVKESMKDINKISR
jgi:hypothetical protein